MKTGDKATHNEKLNQSGCMTHVDSLGKMIYLTSGESGCEADHQPSYRFLKGLPAGEELGDSSARLTVRLIIHSTPEYQLEQQE